MQLKMLEHFPMKSISKVPDGEMGFLVIVITSARLSPGDSTVLMRPSVLVFNFKPEPSTTHV
jgi:ureidoglycolate hydrolase